MFVDAAPELFVKLARALLRLYLSSTLPFAHPISFIHAQVLILKVSLVNLCKQISILESVSIKPNLKQGN